VAQSAPGITRPAQPHAAGGDGPGPDDASFWQRHRRAAIGVLGVLLAVGAVFFLLPHLVGLGPTLERLRGGHVGWLALGVAFEACSLLSQVVLFRGIFAKPGNRIGWRNSGQITLAGAAATKLMAAAGAGGVAVTVMGLRGYGLSAAEVANGMFCLEILLYGVYMAALAIAGCGLWFGVFSGSRASGLTLIPASFAVAVILIALSILLFNEPVTRSLERRAARSTGRLAPWFHRAATVSDSMHAAMLTALAMVKRRDPAVLGAVGYWGFDIAALWASYRAFGHPPPGSVLIIGYFVGTAANVLPLPGGVGGVEGGMIGAFAGLSMSASLATVAVLGYRTISYWLPTLPGVVAYARLRRSVTRG
jgi:putative heme transporter